MKYNILRTLVQTHQVELAIVPFDYDLENNPSNLQWDGLFLSSCCWLLLVVVGCWLLLVVVGCCR